MLKYIKAKSRSRKEMDPIPSHLSISLTSLQSPISSTYNSKRQCLGITRRDQQTFKHPMISQSCQQRRISKIHEPWNSNCHSLERYTLEIVKFYFQVPSRSHHTRRLSLFIHSSSEMLSLGQGHDKSAAHPRSTRRVAMRHSEHDGSPLQSTMHIQRQ